MLYNLYGVRYRPEQHINYPKLSKRGNSVRSETNKMPEQKTTKPKINYPIMKPKQVKIDKLSLIPKKRKEENIKNELLEIQNHIRTFKLSSEPANRKQQIESLQDKFVCQERTVMPKGARFPSVKIDDIKITPLEQQTDDTLYNKILKEIDDRYVYMEEMKKLGKNVDKVIMCEIRDRIDELKKIKKIMEDD
jgi:hypothetical protein